MSQGRPWKFRRHQFAGRVSSVLETTWLFISEQPTVGLCTGGFRWRSLARRCEDSGEGERPQGGRGNRFHCLVSTSAASVAPRCCTELLFAESGWPELVGGWVASEGLCQGPEVGMGSFWWRVFIFIFFWVGADLFPKRQCYSFCDRSSQKTE